MEAQLEIREGKIQGISPYGSRGADEDYGSKRVVPGFIDVHTHGAYGFDTNDGEPEGLRNWMRRIPEEGVTGILPTTVTQMPEVDTKRASRKPMDWPGLVLTGRVRSTAPRSAPRRKPSMMIPVVVVFLFFISY